MPEEHIYKSHNKTLLLYHFVFPVTCRHAVIDEQVGGSLKEICIEITERYEIHFVEIDYEENDVYLLVQSVPKLSVTKIAGTIKSIRTKELFRRHPRIKQKLWGGNFPASGYYGNTLGRYGNKEVIQQYIENQGRQSNYVRLRKDQLGLFE